MAQGFVYDPSQEISQQFKQTAGGVGNVFAQVIAQRQQDFQFAEKMMENIEALKKDVNLLGQQEVSGEVNNLLKEAGSSIVKSGKLDYSKLGEIRQKVSDIKDLKAGYNVYAKNLETLVNLAAQSKDEIVSVSGLYNQLAGLAKDKDLMKRPNDLSARMRNIYDDNRDADVVVRKNIGSVLGTEKLAQTVEDKSGRYFVQGETYKGATIDPKTRKYNIPQESIDLAYNSLATNNPDLITFLRKKSGVDPGIMNDKQLFAEYMMRSAGAPMSKMEKSQAEVKTEAAQAELTEAKSETAKFEAKNASRLLNADLQVKWSQIRENNAQAQRALSSGQSTGQQFNILESTKKNSSLKEFPLPTKLEVTLNDIKYKKEPLGNVDIVSLYTINGQPRATVMKSEKVRVGPGQYETKSFPVEVRLNTRAVNAIDNAVLNIKDDAIKNGYRSTLNNIGFYGQPEPQENVINSGGKMWSLLENKQ